MIYLFPDAQRATPANDASSRRPESTCPTLKVSNFKFYFRFPSHEMDATALSRFCDRMFVLRTYLKIVKQHAGLKISSVV